MPFPEPNRKRIGRRVGLSRKLPENQKSKKLSRLYTAGRTLHRFRLFSHPCTASPKEIRELYPSLGLDANRFRVKIGNKHVFQTVEAVEELKYFGFVSTATTVTDPSKGYHASFKIEISILLLARAVIRRESFLNAGKFERLSPKEKDSIGKALIFLALNRLDSEARDIKSESEGISFHGVSDPGITLHSVVKKMTETMKLMELDIRARQTAIRESHSGKKLLDSPELMMQLREIQNESKACVHAIEMLKSPFVFTQAKEWLREQRMHEQTE